MLYKTEGIIIKTMPLGEADKLVTIYTEGHGKLRAVAKGNRKPRNRMSGRIELFCRNSFVLSEGKSLDIITQADIIQNYYPIQKDLDKIMLASYIAKVINHGTLPSFKSCELYHLLLEIFDLIANHTNYGKIRKIFQKKYLEIEGVSTGNSVSSDEEFDSILYNNP